MMQPTIGRVVWYHPQGLAGYKEQNIQPWPAFITEVISQASEDTPAMVNVAGFDNNGYQFHDSHINLYVLDEESYFSWAPTLTWMPYQVEQAKKTEQE